MSDVSYKVGDIIEQHCFGCKESARLVRVTTKHSNVKNAKKGFDGVMVNGGYTVWGYDSDVFRVVTPAPDFPERCTVCLNPGTINHLGYCSDCVDAFSTPATQQAERDALQAAHEMNSESFVEQAQRAANDANIAFGFRISFKAVR